MFELFTSVDWLGADLLTTMLLLPLLGALVLLFVPDEAKRTVRWTGILTSGATLVVSILAWVRFDPSRGLDNLRIDHVWMPTFGIHYLLGMDGLSLALVLLTTLLTFCVLLVASGQSIEKWRGYVAMFLVLETGMLGSLLALDTILFYVFWELMLIPMYFIIGIWGGKRRIYAAMKFFLFTFVGSLLMFVAILFTASAHAKATGIQTFSVIDWTRAAASGAWGLSPGVEALLFGAFALAFLVKVPLFPFHTWLPDAHVEAPTGGSIILAGVLLKLGTYGLLRFAIPLYPHAAKRYAPLIGALALIGVVYGAWVAAAQKDMKKLVAYSSVSHLGLVVLGIVAGTATAITGAIVQMVGHGLTTGLLFLLVGVLYERRHTREMADYGGVARMVPVTTTLFLIATLGSVGLPGLNGFVGEFLILAGVFKVSVAWAAIGATGMILGAIYLLTLVQNVFWGSLKVDANRGLTDINGWELAGALPLIALVVLLGVWPAPLLSMVESSVNHVVEMGARPSNSDGRVASAGGPDARPRDRSCSWLSAEGARTPQMALRRRNPKGERDLRPISALLGDEAESQLLLRPSRLDLGRNSRSRGHRYYSDGLPGMLR